MSKGVSSRLQGEMRCQLCKGRLGTGSARKLAAWPGFGSVQHGQASFRRITHVAHVAAIEPAAEGALQGESPPLTDANGHSHSNGAAASYRQQQGQTDGDNTRYTRRNTRRARSDGSDDQSQQQRGGGARAGGRSAGTQRGKGYVRATNGLAPTAVPAAVKALEEVRSLEEVSEVLDKHDGEITLFVLTAALVALRRISDNGSLDTASPQLQSLLDHIVELSAHFIDSPDVKEHIRMVNRLEALGYKTKEAKIFVLLLHPLDQLGSIVPLNKNVVSRLGSMWDGGWAPKNWSTKYALARRIRGLGMWKTLAEVKKDLEKRRAEEAELVRQIFSTTSVDDLVQLSDEILSVPVVSRGRILVRAHQMLGKLLSPSTIERNQSGAAQSDLYEEWQTARPELVDDRVKALLQRWAEQLPALLAQKESSKELNMGPVLWCWARLQWLPSQDLADEVISNFVAEARKDVTYATWKQGTGYYTSQGLAGLPHLPGVSLDAVEAILEHVQKHTAHVVAICTSHALSCILVACVRANITRPPAWWEPLLSLHLERNIHVMKAGQLQHYTGLLRSVLPEWPVEWDQKLPMTKKLWENTLISEQGNTPFDNTPDVVKAASRAETYQQVIDTIQPHWGHGRQEYVAAAVRQMGIIYSARRRAASTSDTPMPSPDPELAAVMPSLREYLAFVADRIDSCFPWLLSTVTSNLSMLAKAEPLLFADSVDTLSRPVAAFFCQHADHFNEPEYSNIVQFLQRVNLRWDDTTDTSKVAHALLDQLGIISEDRARVSIPATISLGVKFDNVGQGRLLKYIMSKKMYWAGFKFSIRNLAPTPSDKWDAAVLKHYSNIWDTDTTKAAIASIKDAGDLAAVMKVLDDQGPDVRPLIMANAFRRIGVLYSTFRLNKSAAESATADQDATDLEAAEDASGLTRPLPLDDSARAAVRKLASSLLCPAPDGSSPTDDVEVLRPVMYACAHLGVDEAVDPLLIEEIGDPVLFLSGKLLQALKSPDVYRGAAFSEVMWSAATLGYKPEEEACQQIAEAFLERFGQFDGLVWQMRATLRSLIKLGVTLSPEAAERLMTALDVANTRPSITLSAMLQQLCPPDTPGLSSPAPTGPLSPEALSQLIRKSRRLPALQRLYTEHKDSLSPQQAALLLHKAVQAHISARYQAAGRAGGASITSASQPPASHPPAPEMFAELTCLVYSHLDGCDIDILHHLSYALARMDPEDCTTVLAAAGTTVEALLPRLQGFFFAFVPDMSPAAYAETVWSLGRLGYAPDTTGLMVLGERLLMLLPDFSALALRMLLTSFVGFRARTAPEVIEQLISHVHENHLDASPKILRVIMQSLESMCTEVRPEWSQKYVLCAQYWGRKESAWASAIGDASLTDLKTLLESLPADFIPSDFILIFNRLAELAPVSDANQGMQSNKAAEDDGEEGSDEGAEDARSGQDWTHLGPVLVDNVMQRLRDNLAAYQAWQVGRVLQIAARLDARPDEAWLEAFLDHAMMQLPSMSRNTSASIVEALGRLGYFAGEPRLTALLNQLRADVMSSNRATRPSTLVSALVGAARVYFIPDAEWRSWFLDCSQGLLTSCGPMQIVELVVALSRVSCRPEEAWLKSLLEVVEVVYPKLKSRDKGRLVRALERIGGELPLQQGAVMQ